MKLLKELRKKYKALLARAKELGEIDADTMTDEQLEELRGMPEQIRQTQTDIDAALALEAAQAAGDDDGDDDGDAASRSSQGQGSGMTVEDQPIYRGGGAHALGQQLRDIMSCSDPSVSGQAVTEARSRLDQCQRRTMDRIAQNADREGRAAGTGMIQGIGSEGGFLLQGETSVELMTTGFNNSEVLKRCSNRTLTNSDFVDIIGIDETSRANGYRAGGIRVYTTAELEQMTSSKPNLKKVRIEPKELTGLFYVSDKLLRNATFLGQEISQLFGEEFAFKAQDLVIRGDGAGEALGILNSGCLVSVTRSGATIATADVLDMDARVWNDSAKGLVWLVNRDCKPSLATMVITAGDTNALLYRTFNNMGVRQATLNGTPCVTIEQCESVGTVGDILLCDFSQYITANRGDISEATSIHVKFEYNQTAFRFVYYFDGQPRWTSAVTPYKGTNTVSPFVALATAS